MKKLLSISLLLLTTVFVSACSDSAKKSETHDDTGMVQGHHEEKKSTEEEHDDSKMEAGHHEETKTEDHDDSEEPPHRH